MEKSRPSNPRGISILESEKILVRGVNWLGDAIMTTPALIRLRECAPKARISLLVPSKLADLWIGHAAVDAIIPFETSESVWNLSRRLSRQKFDSSVILPNSPRSALESWLAGIPRRIGYSGKWRRWLLTDALPQRLEHIPTQKKSLTEIQQLTNGTSVHQASRIPAAAHHIHHYLHIISYLGGNPEAVPPQIAVAPDEVSSVLQRFHLPAPAQLPLLGLNPGAEYGPAKRWPAERFIAAAIEIQKTVPCSWVILGGKSDVALAEEIAAGINQKIMPRPDSRKTQFPSAVTLAGQTTLRELCAVLKLCQVLLTNDTGPMHVAAAVGTPVVVPFGSTSPELTGPGIPGETRHRLIQSQVPCSPCFLRVCPIDFRCMHSISVDMVVRNVLDVVQASTSQRHRLV